MSENVFETESTVRCIRFVYARIIYRSYFKYVLNGLGGDIFLSTTIISSVRRVHCSRTRTLFCCLARVGRR